MYTYMDFVGAAGGVLAKDITKFVIKRRKFSDVYVYSSLLIKNSGGWWMNYTNVTASLKQDNPVE